MVPPHTRFWVEKGELMSLIRKILDVLYPPVCLLCGERAERHGMLCDGCYRRYAGEAFLRCEVCGQRAGRCECGIDGIRRMSTPVGDHPIAYLTFYVSTRREETEDRVTEQMIFRLKRKNEFAPFFAAELCREVRILFDTAGESLSEWVITFPPRSEEKYRKCGFDQSEEIAQLMAKELGIPLIRMFRRAECAVEQKELNRQQRVSNAEESLIPIPKRIPKGGKILLFDDIFTSGATLSTAMRHLYFHGASAVFPIAIAKSYEWANNSL